MEELPWLKEYSGQTTDELIALEGKYRTDSIVCAFEQALDQKGYKLGDESISSEELVIVAIEALEREVNNGGYAQFFTNSSVEFTPIIESALNAIGCHDVAQLTLEAMKILGISNVSSEEDIEAAVDFDNDELMDKLSEIDQRYFAETGCLADPLFLWIKDNRSNIRLGA